MAAIVSASPSHLACFSVPDVWSALPGILLPGQRRTLGSAGAFALEEALLQPSPAQLSGPGWVNTDRRNRFKPALQSLALPCTNPKLVVELSHDSPSPSPST